MMEGFKYRTCGCDNAEKVERQVMLIRSIKLDRRQLFRENHNLTVENKALRDELTSVKAQLETMKACDEDKARQLKGFYSENQRKLRMAVVSPDRNFDSRPREEW